MLARSVPKEQEDTERRQLHKSWEMAAILDFLDLFREDLKLDRAFTAHELESVLILSPGGEGLLGAVHTVRLLALAYFPTMVCIFSIAMHALLYSIVFLHSLTKKKTFRSIRVTSLTPFMD